MKRRIIKLCMFLLLGAIINIAVAWGFSIWGFRLEHSHKAWQRTPMSEYDRHWILPPDWKPRQATEFLSYEIERTNLALPGIEMQAFEEMSLPTSRSPGRFLMSPWKFALCVRAGWPMASLFGLKYDVGFDSGPRTYAPNILAHDSHDGYPTLNGSSVQLSFAFELPSRVGSIDVPPGRLMPLHPIWPGLVVNAIFYAAILWFPFAAFARIHRWRRVKRGLCPACAYPIGESDLCTECGKMTTPARRSVR